MENPPTVESVGAEAPIACIRMFPGLLVSEVLSCDTVAVESLLYHNVEVMFYSLVKDGEVIASAAEVG